MRRWGKESSREDDKPESKPVGTRAAWPSVGNVLRALWSWSVPTLLGLVPILLFCEACSAGESQGWCLSNGRAAFGPQEPLTCSILGSALLAYALRLAAAAALTAQIMKAFYTEGGLHEIETTFTSWLLVQVAHL